MLDVGARGRVAMALFRLNLTYIFTLFNNNSFVVNIGAEKVFVKMIYGL